MIHDGSSFHLILMKRLDLILMKLLSSNILVSYHTSIVYRLLEMVTVNARRYVLGHRIKSLW